MGQMGPPFGLLWGVRKGVMLYVMHTHVSLGTHSNISKAQATIDRADGHYFCPESHIEFSKFYIFAQI